MKYKTIIFTIIFLLTIPFVLSDGGMMYRHNDLWGMADEGQQLAAINNKEGIQNMILSIETNEQLIGDKVVWIFPVPAVPEKTSINVLKKFPTFNGLDIEEKIEHTISDMFSLMRVTQIYSLPVLYFTTFTGIGSVMGSIDGRGVELLSGLTIHETIERYGLTTELVSTTNSQSFEDYLISKDLEPPKNFKNILNDYIGQEYSFVISWISDVETYKKEQKNIQRNKLGVFISFPTEKLYFPLKPTSVYDNLLIPAYVYVLDYVEPEIYQEIKSKTKTKYYFQKNYRIPDELTDFFFGQKGSISDLKYTKISIISEANHFTQDLWMTISAPKKIQIMSFIERNNFLIGLIIFIISSCLASLIAGLIIFRKDSPSIISFLLFGFFNFLTIIGLSIVAYGLKISKRFTNSFQMVEPITSFGSVLIKTSIISLIAPILAIIGIILSSTIFLSSPEIFRLEAIFIGLIIIVLSYFFLGLFIGPIIWGYHNDRKTMKYIILFSFIFMILTILFKYILKAMI